MDPDPHQNVMDPEHCLKYVILDCLNDPQAGYILHHFYTQHLQLTSDICPLPIRDNNKWILGIEMPSSSPPPPINRPGVIIQNVGFLYFNLVIATVWLVKTK
jgi:hypothetical protein